MLSRIDYLETIEEIVECCAKSIYKDDIIAVYVGGSVARGDFSPGRSDIDVYIITSGKKKEIWEELKEEARKITVRKLKDLMKLHQEPIGITLTTVHEIQTGNSFLGAGFEYHNFINTGKLLYGCDIKPLIPKPSREQEKALANRALKKIYSLIIKHLPYTSEIDQDKLTCAVFSTIFRTACVALCGEGRYVSGKREAVSAFHEVYAQESGLCRIISKSFELWEEWQTRTLTKEELQQLMRFYLEFVSKICNLWGVTNK